MQDSVTVYKVVRKSSEGKLLSDVVAPPLQRTYVVGRWHRGYKGTPLLAFGSQEAAMRFARWGHDSCVVFVAEAENVKRITWVSIYYDSPREVLAFWSNHGETMAAPLGTVSCRRLKLVEEVHEG